MSVELSTIRAGLAACYDPRLVDELLEAYTEAKKNYYAGGLRLSAVEGGRFCEAVFRILQERTTASFTSLGKQLDTEKLINQLANISPGTQPDSIRLHIPRTLRLVYDIRNKRDAAHLADGINPNVQDATLVISSLDWVLAELVRLHHSISANEAQRLVDTLVTRSAPVVESFGTFLKVLNPKLSAPNFVLVLLYQVGKQGATYEQLYEWVHPKMRSNMRTTLRRLEHDRAFVHDDGQKLYITTAGLKETERLRLIAPA